MHISQVSANVNKLAVPTINYPVLTAQGHRFLEGNSISGGSLQNASMPQNLRIHLEADMIEALKMPLQSTSEAQEWGRGWADPAIRRQRLSGGRGGRGSRGRGRKGKKSRRRRQKPDVGTVQGRLAAKVGPIRRRWQITHLLWRFFLLVIFYTYTRCEGFVLHFNSLLHGTIPDPNALQWVSLANLYTAVGWRVIQLWDSMFQYTFILIYT